MTPNEKRFYNDLKKNGKKQEWSWYSSKYFQGRDAEYARKVATRLKVYVKPAAKTILKPVFIKDRSAQAISHQEQAFLDRLRRDGVYGTNAQMTRDYFPHIADPDHCKTVMRRYNYVIKAKSPTPQTQIQDRKRDNEVAEVKDQNKELSNQLLAMERALEKYANIAGYDPKKFAISEPVNKQSHEAAAIIQWSDWHVEETVLSTTVNGLNAYDLKTAKRRATTLFENGLKLINTQRAGVDIKDLVIHLGGDFITGYIHSEGEQTNELSPINACKYAIDLLTSGIEYYLSKGEFKHIRIICSRGNHGRTTKKMQSNDFEMNNELFIYYFLMTYFKSDARVIFQANESSFSYMTVYGRVLRFFHGHQVKYKGGIGGMTVPMVKLILRLDANTPAYYNFMGDKHTYCQPTPNCQVNGSLIGYNAYAADLGLNFQEPVQALTLLDSKRGATVKCPIFCD